VKKQLRLPGYSGDASQEFTIYKNEDGAYSILDVFCRPVIADGREVGRMTPKVKYLRIPGRSYGGEHEVRLGTPAMPTLETTDYYSYPPEE